MQTVKGAVENPDIVDRCVLKSYVDKITSLDGKLQGLKEKIFSPEDACDLVLMASDIEGTLFNLRLRA